MLRAEVRYTPVSEDGGHRWRKWCPWTCVPGPRPPTHPSVPDSEPFPDRGREERVHPTPRGRGP